MESTVFGLVSDAADNGGNGLLAITQGSLGYQLRQHALLLKAAHDSMFELQLPCLGGVDQPLQ
jgi:hypothetical protein